MAREHYVLVIVGIAAMTAGSLLHREATAVALVGFGAGLLALGILANRMRSFELSATGLKAQLGDKVRTIGLENGMPPEKIEEAVAKTKSLDDIADSIVRTTTAYDASTGMYYEMPVPPKGTGKRSP